MRDADRGAVSHARRSRGRRSATLGGHDRLRNPAARPSATRPSRRCRTTTTCIRTAICMLGRVDAVLLDNVLASGRRRAMPGLHDSAADASRSATTSASSRRANARAARSHQRHPAQAMRDGRSKRSSGSGIVWNDDQPALYARLLAGRADASRSSASTRSPSVATDVELGAGARRYLPSLLARVGDHDRAVVPRRWRSRSRSASSIATGRVYGSRLVRAALTGYVELMRGTPMLLQLFVLYYGLAVGDPPAGVRRGAARARPELRRVRERDLSRRARSRAARAARGGAHARASASARC